MYISLSSCLFLSSALVVTASDDAKSDKVVTVDCSTLRLGQYICPDPIMDQINPDTQQFQGCVKGKEIPSEGEAEGKYKHSLQKPDQI